MSMFHTNEDEVKKSYVTTKVVEKADGKQYSVPVVVYFPVLTISKCNQLILTRWLPEELRWEFYTKDSPPIWFLDVEVPAEALPLRGYGEQNSISPKN